MKRILIIEDDPVIAHIYRTRLENETYAVETCHDGQSGLDRVQEMNPDAILLDLMLPKMNGIEFLKKIRGQSRFASMPVVVFTNAYLPNMIQEAIAAGASHVYNKATLTPKQLLDCFYFLIHGQSRGADPFATGLRGSSGAGLAPKTSRHERLRKPGEVPGSPPLPVFDSELYRAFISSKPETIAELRAVLQQFMETSDDAIRDRHVLDLYRKVHALTARASLANFADIAQISSALEVLLKELHEQPSHINVSTLRTVAQSVDFIGELLNLCEPRCGDLPAPNILVVDDEILSRRAIMHALEKGNLKSTGLEDSVSAFRLVGEEEYDLIILDIQMPAFDGFELCARIRSFPTNQNTPVLFVTCLTDFKNRAKATVCGGTDFIAKPFFFIEVTLKAITLVLRKRLMPRLKTG
ncbi:MAG TPA: response regulator [Verrucomicrobiae bacterium]|nr:response regulator [Verrucomicrobiae bacterium]